MSSATAEKKRWTLEEYLVMERASPERHEFVAGEIFAMAGCSHEHDRICLNISSLTGRMLASGACEPFTSNMRVYIPSTGRVLYPDDSVACNPAFLNDAKDVLLNPCVIFEVLSSSTEAYDRGMKFEFYRGISTLQDYVLVSQHKMLVEHFSRQPNGRWLLHEIRDAEELLQLTAVPIAVAIKELYRRITFPSE